MSPLRCHGVATYFSMWPGRKGFGSSSSKQQAPVPLLSRPFTLSWTQRFLHSVRWSCVWLHRATWLTPCCQWKDGQTVKLLNDANKTLTTPNSANSQKISDVKPASQRLKLGLYITKLRWTRTCPWKQVFVFFSQLWCRSSTWRSMCRSGNSIQGVFLFYTWIIIGRSGISIRKILLENTENTSGIPSPVTFLCDWGVDILLSLALRPNHHSIGLQYKQTLTVPKHSMWLLYICLHCPHSNHPNWCRYAHGVSGLLNPPVF